MREEAGGQRSESLCEEDQERLEGALLLHCSSLPPPGGRGRATGRAGLIRTEVQ